MTSNEFTPDESIKLLSYIRSKDRSQPSDHSLLKLIVKIRCLKNSSLVLNNEEIIIILSNERYYDIILKNPRKIEQYRLKIIEFMKENGSSEVLSLLLENTNLEKLVKVFGNINKVCDIAISQIRLYSMFRQI